MRALNGNPSSHDLEKEKQIIILSQAKNELTNENESLRKQLQEKEYEIMSLKTEINYMKSDQNIYENKINQLQITIKSLTEELQIKDTKLFNEKDSSNSRLKEITEAFGEHMQDYQQLLETCNQLEKDNSRLTKGNIEKDATLSQYQHMMFEHKNENKNALNTNNAMQEKEEIIQSLNEQLENEKEKTQKLLSDNNALLLKLNSNKTNVANSNSNNINSNSNKKYTNYDEIIKNIQQNYTIQLNDKDNSYNEMKQNYLNSIKENEKLIEFIIEQIQLIEKSIESNKMLLHMSEQNGTTKIDLLSKNFELLTKKILDVINNENKYNNIQQENTINEIQQIKPQSHPQSHSQSQRALISKQNELNEINAKLNDLSETHDKLFKENSRLQNEYHTLLKQLESFFAEVSNLISQIQNNNNIDSHLQITNISLDLDNTENKLQKIIDVLHILITKVNNATNTISKASSHRFGVENDINNINNNNNFNFDMTNPKDNTELQVRLAQISELLKESNNLLENCRIEKEQLKQQNMKLERNLTILTQSHCEMENNINETQKAKEETLDLYEKKINHLLQNLELKDIQIKSLENFIREIKMKNESHNTSINGEFTGKIVKKGEYKELLRKRGELQPFEKNENHERELNKYLSKFSSDYTFGNYNNDYYRNEIEEEHLNNNNNVLNHSSFNEVEMNLSDNNSVEWNNNNSNEKHINKGTIGKIYKNRK